MRRCLFARGRLQYVIMIWIGRLLSIPLGIVLFVILLVTLIVLEVNDSFLDPDYYPAELRKANVYEWALGDLLSTALEERREYEERVQGLLTEDGERECRTGAEAEEFAERFGRTPLVASGLSNEDIVASVNAAVPPEWVRGLVEQFFDQFGGYLTGQRDEFQVTVKAGDQVVILVDEVKALLRKADAYNLLFDQVVEPEIACAVEVVLRDETPINPIWSEIFFSDGSADRLAEAVRRVVTQEWVHDQVEEALDEVTPYVVGERDTFEISLHITDEMVVTAEEEVKKLLREADAYELVYSEVVEPAVVDNLGQSVELPFGVTVTDEEVIAALRRVAPVEWVQEQAERLIHDVGPYLTGKQDSFATEVSLEDNKREAAEVIVELVNSRLDQLLDEIPECASTEEATKALTTGGLALPKCLPANIPIADILGRLNIDVGDQVQSLVLRPIPNRIKFTEGQLRSALEFAGASDTLEQVDRARKLLKGEEKYTHSELRDELAKLDLSEFEGALGPVAGELDPLVLLDETRAFLADSWSFTDVEFRGWMSDLSWNTSTRGALEDSFGNPPRFGLGTLKIDLTSQSAALDSGRDTLNFFRAYRWVAWVPMLILLVALGFLGGRGWSGRVIYAGGQLAVAAGIIFVLFGPAYDQFSSSGLIVGDLEVQSIDDLRAEAMKEIDVEIARVGNDFPETTRMAANKAFDIMESVIDGFTSGIAASSFGLLTIGIVAILAAIFWTLILATAWRVKDLIERTFMRPA